ncbi:MAG: hypothetical protein OXE86_08015 [Alphaproteobacteria bacterium]|nr:hypothetical protein [Alphaproteobacteria bacterium]
MTGKRDQTGRPPDLLASLPAERPAPGIDPAVIEEIRAGMLELRELYAGLQQAQSADRPARPESEEALKEWFESLVARYAETARVAAPDAAAMAGLVTRIEEAATKTLAAADRIVEEAKGMAARNQAAADRIVEEGKGTVVRTAQIHSMAASIAAVADRIAKQAPGWRFGVGTLVSLMIVSVVPFALGMLFESRALVFYRWLWAG